MCIISQRMQRYKRMVERISNIFGYVSSRQGIDRDIIGFFLIEGLGELSRIPITFALRKIPENLKAFDNLL